MALACHCSRQAWAHAFARPSTVPIAPFVHVKHKYTLSAILGSGATIVTSRTCVYLLEPH